MGIKDEGKTHLTIQASGGKIDFSPHFSSFQQKTTLFLAKVLCVTSTASGCRTSFGGVHLRDHESFKFCGIHSCCIF